MYKKNSTPNIFKIKAVIKKQKKQHSNKVTFKVPLVVTQIGDN